MKDFSSLIEFSEEVRAALADNKPVIALESSIIAQGMPYPTNLETALGMEELARELGVTPATTAVLKGKIKIGLSRAEIEFLAEARKNNDEKVMKLSRKDLSSAIAMGRDGATTVAATMILAHLGGIPVFATGGIGGVHKEAESTFDISADLREFASTPVLVVSAGAKAILDLPKTLEMLETLGVPVIGYRTSVFPAFYSRDSGLPLDLRLDSPSDIAKAFFVQQQSGLNCGMLVANPISPEAEIPGEEMEKCIGEAMAEMKRAGVKGKQVTPFLLSRIAELTESRSLFANIRLVEGNVRLACAIASALKEI
ncbi:MAG TPA: pseudouridine-5-phosphate glycosidase [Cyanobacteria bacterium UBA8530]|nr:pseudouridine-5-phosphate glycosidase [Cyanobacteria bacterium UBA8530]